MMRHIKPEELMHRAVLQHLKLRAVPGLMYWHTPNGAYLAGGKFAWHKLEQLGSLPGVSDLVLLHKGQFYALELKRRGAKPTEAQWAFIDGINRAGGCAMWVDNIDSAINVLEAWELLRGKTWCGGEHGREKTQQGLFSAGRSDV